MSAVGGLKIGTSRVDQDTVVMISIAFLLILFSVQMYVTSKVGLAVGPALFIWFCLGVIGIYNLAKYGDKDVRKENHQTFEQLLIRSLENFIRREAQELSLASDDDADSDAENQESQTRILIAANASMYSLSIPLHADDKNCIQRSTSEASTPSHPAQENSHSAAAAAAEKSLEKELALLHKAKETGVVYLLGHGNIRARKDSWFFKKLIINYFYAFLRKNFRRGTVNLSIPHSNLMQVSMTYMV